MLQKLYAEEIKPKIIKDWNLKNVHSAPRLKKVVVNMGVGNQKSNEAYIEDAKKELALITGQNPVIRRAKKSVSGFELREGEIVGLQSTLRGEKMWAFLEKLIKVVLPRVKDFRGVKRSSFDGHGNYNLGIKEHVVFPEIDASKIKHIKSLQVTINIANTENDEEAEKFLEELGMPFEKEDE